MFRNIGTPLRVIGKGFLYLTIIFAVDLVSLDPLFLLLFGVETNYHVLRALGGFLIVDINNLIVDITNLIL